MAEIKSECKIISHEIPSADVVSFKQTKFEFFKYFGESENMRNFGTHDLFKREPQKCHSCGSWPNRAAKPPPIRPVNKICKFGSVSWTSARFFWNTCKLTRISQSNNFVFEYRDSSNSFHNYCTRALSDNLHKNDETRLTGCLVNYAWQSC